MERGGIYLDHAASTPLLPEAWEAMRPYFAQPGNAASSHAFGRRARRALEGAREQVAELLDAAADEVVFTSGATEANNLAILGLAAPAPGTLVTSAVEHPCVLEPVNQLHAQGYTHRHLPVTREGIVDLDRSELPEDVRLVGVMLANHETGAIQPVAELAQRLAGRAPFHCDAAAGVAKIPVSFRRLGVDALTVSAHKFHGPQGVGALVVRGGTKLRPLLFGGHQQQGRRPGTEPVALAVGLAVALAWSVRNLDAHTAKVRALRQRLLEHLQTHAAPIIVNGPEHGVPHLLNVSFPGCQADALLMALDLAGVACSTGSACSSGSLLPSPVLAAMAVPADALRSAMRFSLSATQEADEVGEAGRRIAAVVKKLRQLDSDSE